MGSLRTYREKRDFQKTSEPAPRRGSRGGNQFVVQKHDARRLHFDLRLELDGVLKSWAVTRGPSLVPGEKRLAVQTEDHPMEYLEWEGVIPKGEYGGGTMIVWDRGTWEAEGDPRKGLVKGKLDFSLSGQRLKGKRAEVVGAVVGSSAEEHRPMIRRSAGQASCIGGHLTVP